jgi:hypothetical protein
MRSTANFLGVIVFALAGVCSAKVINVNRDGQEDNGDGF